MPPNKKPSNTNSEEYGLQRRQRESFRAAMSSEVLDKITPPSSDPNVQLKADLEATLKFVRLLLSHWLKRWGRTRGTAPISSLKVKQIDGATVVYVGDGLRATSLNPPKPLIPMLRLLQQLCEDGLIIETAVLDGAYISTSRKTTVPIFDALKELAPKKETDLENS